MISPDAIESTSPEGLGSGGAEYDVLRLAARCGDPAAFERIYDLKICAPRERGAVSHLERRMCLCDAAREGDAEMCRTLLRLGFGLEEGRDLEGNTPLHVCAALGHDGACALLSAESRDVDALNLAGETPLCLAAGSGMVRCCKILLARGARQDAGETRPLLAAARGGHAKTCRLLLLGKGEAPPRPPLVVSGEGEQESSLLRAAIRSRSIGTCRAVLRSCGRPSVADIDLSVELDLLPIARLLLRRSGPRADLGSALHTACRRRARISAEMCALLLLHGADPNALDAFGASPLHFAAEGRADVCELLLSGGAAAFRDERGFTPLIVAAGRGDALVCELLLGSGTDQLVDAEVAPGVTALSLAEARGHAEVCELIGSWKYGRNVSKARDPKLRGRQELT